MRHSLRGRTTYLITSGEATGAGADLARLLALVERAAAARVGLIQLREKSLTARSLYELTERAAALTRGTQTLLLVNDRADVARAAGADGVHLTTRSLEAAVVRRSFGEDLLIGVSTHTLEEARAARDGGADFATFGPVFDSPLKRRYGPPVGLAALSGAAHALAPFPVFALGGISLHNAAQAFAAGARGVAAIRLFGDAANLDEVVRAVERRGPV